VRLYSAVSKQTVRFRELREGDGSRVKQWRRGVRRQGGPPRKIVKGYEYAPDQYVVLSRDELGAAAAEPRDRDQDRVDLDEIDPIYFEQPYYPGPRVRRARPRASSSGDEDARKVAVARFVLRNKGTWRRSARWTTSSR
jgi:DNA end-binding protein Ku